MTVRSIEEMRAASHKDMLLPFEWVGPRDRVGGRAHLAVAVAPSKETKFHVLCGRSWTAEPGEDPRDNAKGHLPCPVCLAKLVYMTDGAHDRARPDEDRWLAEHALRQIGWKDGDPLPVIWRVAGRPADRGA